MFFQVLSIPERFSTMGTYKRSLSCVNTLMDQKLCLCVAKLAAIGTLKCNDNRRFLLLLRLSLRRIRSLRLPMSLNVFNQVIQRRADLFANDTNLLCTHTRSMRILFMDFQKLCFRELSRARITSEGSISRLPSR